MHLITINKEFSIIERVKFKLKTPFKHEKAEVIIYKYQYHHPQLNKFSFFITFKDDSFSYPLYKFQSLKEAQQKLTLDYHKATFILDSKCQD